MDVDFDDDSTEPLAVRSEVGETPQVVDPLDRDGRVLELATSVGRTAAVRSSVAVTAPVELAVSVTKRRDTGGDDGIAVRLVDDRSGAAVGLVESSDGDVRHTVSNGDSSGTETASVGGIDVGTWERVTVTVDEDGTQSARGDRRATISGDDWTDRPLRADLTILGRSDEGAVTAWFDDLAVTSL